MVAAHRGDVVTRVLLADDQALVRKGFRLILELEGDMEVVGEAADGAEALVLIRELEPDVVVMDIRMPEVDGIEATRRLQRAGSAARVLILTTFDLDEYVYEAMRAGAAGFLLKDVPSDQLVAAIRTVEAGEALLSPTLTRRLIEHFVHRPPPGVVPPRGLDTLTERETEVLTLVARGLSNAEIATTLFLGEATVKTHIGRILQKLDLRDRVQAVVLAYECGLVQAGVEATER
jgi:DNA-binding NarL/FixJ family response regulator